MGRQKRNRMANSKLIIPPIHQTFRLGGCINSSLLVENKDIVAPFLTFTINVTTEEETAESVCPVVYPCSPNFELNNWSTVEIPVVYELSK